MPFLAPLKTQNLKIFRGFALGPHWGGGAYSAPPPTPQLLVNSLRPLRGLRSSARYARFSLDFLKSEKSIITSMTHTHAHAHPNTLKLTQCDHTAPTLLVVIVAGN